MSLSLLIVTPQKSFGEHIAQSVKEKHSASVTIVDTQGAALYALTEGRFTHAFLDMDLTEPIADLGLALRQKDPNLHLILISTNQSIPRFDALRPWDYLHKPFFMPDLLRVLGQEERPAMSIARFEKAEKTDLNLPVAEEKAPLRWLSDTKAKEKAVPHLTRLTLESAAQATLIVRDGALWAYAGQLSEAAADELVKIVVRDKKSGDLLKFLRLKATDAEHMLFATVLIDEVVLTMIFDAETPFSAIRHQAAQLVDSLIVLEPKTMPMEAVSVEDAEAEKNDTDELLELFDFDEEEDAPPISAILDNIPLPNPRGAAAEAKTSAPTSTPGAPPASLSGVHQEPMPNPFAKTRASTAVKEDKAIKESSPAIRASDFFHNGEDNLDETRVQAAHREQEITPTQEETRAQPAQQIDFDLDETRVSESQRPETPVRKPKPEELASTRPQSITEVTGRVIIEPSSSELYELTYACLLVPRFSNHHLTGDLADRLSEWMPNICVAFGWRLEFLAVRPDYLQWVLNVPPTTSPGYLMRIMRRRTSERIFEDFPRFQKENPSGDFWAPGYLIMGGSQPHPSKLVKDYINRTRERQGA